MEEMYVFIYKSCLNDNAFVIIGFEVDEQIYYILLSFGSLPPIKPLELTLQKMNECFL